MEKEKKDNVEDKLYTIDDLPDQEQHELYMPNKHKEHKKLWEKMEDFSDKQRPKNWKDWTTMVVFPHGYTLWKLPPKVHHYVNKVLGYATEALAPIQPEAALGTGIAYGISQVVYGIKTKSGKHVGSGIGGLVENLKKADIKELKPFLKKAEDIIGQYFHNFNEAKA